MGSSPSSVVLVVDDDAAFQETLADGLRAHGFEVVALGPDAARTEVANPRYHVLVTDLRMPVMDGLSVLGLSKRSAPERPVIVMTAFGAVDSAVESLRAGAYHYLLKPFKVSELALVVQRAVDDRALRHEARSLKAALRERFAADRLVAVSASMRRLRELLERVADTDITTLVVGETGTGKGVFARALHAESSRAGAPFVSINCAAIPENLLESELFGHVRGAFTGAHRDRKGLFEQADGGVIFLDEIGDMVPALQAKLLDVLERRAIRALGAETERSVDVRVIAATHRDLRARVATGQFREDLLYRLEGVVVDIPPLRQRRDDILPLATRFLDDARATKPSLIVERFAPAAIEHMLAYDWPGNVRELENAVTRAVMLGREPEATLDDFPPGLARPRKAELDFGDAILPVRELQRRYAMWVLERVGGRKTVACEKLGIDAKTLNRWLAADDADVG